MSAQANPNSQAPQAGAPEQPQEFPEIQKLYKDLTLYIRDTYFPHYNLYQRAMLQEKVRCYEAYNKEPDQYFVCIDKVEEAMRSNAQQIKRRFDIAEQVDNHCKTECKDLHTDKDQYVKCVAGCASSMKDACSSIYNQFYTKVIGDLPEYQKIKK